MLGEGYVRLVLALAPLVVCLAWSCEARLSRPALLAASLFAAGVWLEPLAVWAALPWLLLCLGLALTNLRELLVRKPRTLAPWVRLAAHLYLPVGSVWTLFYQAGIQPLGFPPVIVLLTGVHFHYAGFALPWLTGRWLGRRPHGRSGRVCAAGVMAGVPLVALGITSSQLGLPPSVETVAVTVLAGSAFGVSHGYLVWSGQTRGASRYLFALGGLALALGMVLALLYGWRTAVPLEWVTIPAMYTVHGSLNSWGFCLPCILGNKLLGRDRETPSGSP